MKRLTIAALCIGASLSGVAQTTNQNSDPTADPKAVVMAGNDVRFTVLTDGMVRMEWATEGVFTDQASFVAVNRRTPVPDFEVKHKGKTITITTSKFELTYKVGSGRFDKHNLSVRSLIDRSKFVWTPSSRQSCNLKGTYRTLDGYDGDTHSRTGEKMAIEDGLLARDGWTLIDESNNFLFDNSDWSWVTKRTDSERQDWYLMIYGTGYKQALADYALVAGSVPLPPRFAFGYWWSRYWSYSDTELRDLTAKFDRYQIPLDVMVIDMDWHRVDSVLTNSRDQFGQRKWWTGWTWNRNLFPAPEKLIGWFDSQSIKTTLNLHPASGIAPHEECYEQFAKAVDFDTSTGQNIPNVASDKRYVTTLFDVVLHPMQRYGIDFWWLDWQQWKDDPAVEGLSNTWWLNYLFFSDMERNGNARPMLYHRWGGLGNHRYQIGFSGDAIISWRSLAFQPYFTASASNVLYGYWSHDLGGHMFAAGQEHRLDPELYTRWMQYGVFSPIFRTHSTKDTTLNKELWNFGGAWFDALWSAVDLRYRLVPYIYSAAYQCHTTGISICRPMYYDYPDNEESYARNNEYMFGDDMIVVPVTTPMQNGVSTVEVWLPEGSDWYEWHTGTLLKGGYTGERQFAIDQYPVYVRAGAVVPMYASGVKRLDNEPDKIELALFPGASGSTVIYSDSGNDKAYDSRHATTTVSTLREGNRLTVEIGATTGRYEGIEPTRHIELHIYAAGYPVKLESDTPKADISYRGSELCLVVDLGDCPTDRTKRIVVEFDDNTPLLTDGLASQMRELNKALTEMKSIFTKNSGATNYVPDRIVAAGETALRLEYFPDRFNATVAEMRSVMADLPAIAASLQLTDEQQQWLLNRLAPFR